MKTLNYEQVTEKTLLEVQTYILERAQGQYLEELIELSYRHYDMYCFKRAINKRHALQLYLFSMIKKCVDQSESYDEMEEHFIMMNLIIDKDFKPLVDFKYNMFFHILERKDITLETYCLMRHLISFKVKKLDDIIKTMTSYKNISEYEYHHISSEILLLERQYKKAYNHLPYIEFDQSLYRFKNQLYNYSPILFEELTLEPVPNRILLIA